MTRFLVAVLALVIFSSGEAVAQKPRVHPADDAFDAILSQSKGGAAMKNPRHNPDTSASSAVSEVKVAYEWRNVCGAGKDGVQTTCPKNDCPPGQQIYRLWQVTPPPPAPMGLVCSGNGPPPATAAAAPPQVTEAMVLNAFRRIPLPSLRSHSQPADKTLINFDTSKCQPDTPSYACA